MTHACHANGCTNEDTHKEIPFCKRHWSMLPKPHQAKLWDGRGESCFVCLPRDEPENMLAGGEVVPVTEWEGFANLGIALLCYVEYGAHDCPESLLDDDGFCWGCGVNDAKSSYEQCKAIAKKFKLKVRS